MARPVWSGVLSLGLVTVPVSMFSAVDEHTVHFHQVERGTSDRVRNQRVNERTGKEVAFDDIVKGYDTGDGGYVTVEADELDEIAPGKSQVLEIDGFVDLTEVEPVYFGRTYYLAPRSEEYAKIYQVLRTALEKSDRAGIATFTMRNKQYLTALRAEPDVMIVQLLHWADEVRDPRDELPDLPRRPNASNELDMALQLVEAMSMDWRPGDYHDTYEERVHALVEAKLEGREPPEAEATPEATNVIDLETALRSSIEKAKGGGRRGGAGGGAKSGSASGRATGKDSGGRRGGGPARRSGKADGPPDLDGMTKDELYRLASEEEVPGRSRMSRDDLVKALRKKTGRRGGKRGKAA
ncbi:non-homologous end joining protein Ku [Actinacidiphila acidipaludis]|uniref:Non-homologous end joining protein Ku n=1 Tax=Actinacidiphila acidipaludis TaxID=2873382 RepID=A0ABS7QJT2_9ACTN|nr:Ku protein [Streptomyces acidipaludis]MBY8883051.1 Ku protein [Streptomyces acidipaludis]